MGRLVIWTYSHFAVDFGCFYILFAGLKAHMGTDLQTLSTGFLAYNTIAFGLQAVIGLACDERPAVARYAGLLGIGGVTAAVLLVMIGLGTDLLWAAMVLAALGNAAFHVGGGVDVLARSGGRQAPSGIFVSSGAMGVALGTQCGSGILTLALTMAALAGASWLYLRDQVDLLTVDYRQSTKISSGTDSAGERLRAAETLKPLESLGRYEGYIPFTTAREGSFLVPVGLLMAAVFVRSYAGSIFPIEWEKAGLLVIAPSLAACLGKASGGILADRLGSAHVGVISLLISVPLICLGSGLAAVSLLGILLFNMTMPITLCGLAALMPRNLGFAFGLTTLALLIGVGITYFWAMPEAWVKPAVAVLTVGAAICIGLSVNNSKKSQ